MLVSRQNTDRQSFKRLEQAIRTEKAQPLIRQMYRANTIVRQIADKDICSDMLNIKQRALMAGTPLTNWYRAVKFMQEG